MTRDGIRAVALAAIMVVSMVAVGAGFAGSVAGQADVHTVGSGDADFNTLSEALDSENVSEGDTIEVRDGTYQELVEVDIDGLTITGVGDPLIDVPGSGAGGGEPNIKVTGSDVTIEGLTVDVNNPDGAPAGGIIFEGDNGTAVDNTVVNTGDAVSGQGFIAGGGDSLHVEDNTLNDTIVAYWGNGDAEIRNNEFVGEVTDEALWSTTAGELTVENNDFSAVDTGAATVKFTEDAVTVNGDTGAGAVAAAVGDSNQGVDSVTSAGQTYDGSGNVLVSGSDSIQQAIDNAEPGATIAVDGGTYEEQLTIDKKGISLVAGDGTPQLTYGDGVVVQVRAANVSISGFDIAGDETFDNGNLGIDVRETPDGASVEVTDTTFEDVYLGIQTGSGGPYSFTAENATVKNSVSGFAHQSETGSAVVRDSNISVNTQGVGLYKANNALVENNTVSVDADAIDGVDPVFDTERGVDVSGSNITIADNDITSTDTGILSESFDVPVENVTIVDNEIDADGVAVDDAPDNLNLTGILAGNDFDRAAYVGADGVGSDAIYGAIDPAVSTAEGGDTVVIESGTYAENVSVGTANVTLVGQGDDTVIRGSVALGADETTLSQVRVNATIGDVFPNPAADNNAINVVGESTRVTDVSVDVTLAATKSWQEPIGIEVSGASTNATIEDSSVVGTANFTDDRVGLVGVSTRAGAQSTILNSEIDVTSDGYSFAVVARGDGTETTVRSNELSATGNGDNLDGVGFGVEDGASPQAQTVRFNTFDGVDTIENKAGSGELDVTGNYWTNLTDVEFLTDADTFDESQKGGEITYDPFLTVEPDEIDAESLDETTQFGHDLVVPADGDTHSVAFPAAVNGTVGDVFDGFNGTIYAYDGSSWQSGAEIENESISALDAFAVTLDEDADDQRITFEYADVGSNIPSMTSTELEAGWNFVGAPSNGTVSNAFGVSTTEVASVVNVVGGPADKSTPYRLAGSDDINPTTVGPFQGYWVFATDDGELGAAVPVGPTQSDEETTLKGK